MKNRFLPAAVALALAGCCSSPALAAPRGAHTQRLQYLRLAEPLGCWSIGAYSESRDRRVEVGRWDRWMTTRNVMGYVGYDFRRWFTPYATAGRSKSRVGKDEHYGESDHKFGLGAVFRLLDHDIMDPMLLEDRFQIDAGCQYAWLGTRWMREDLDWRELYLSLTASIINDVDGNKLYLPKSVGLFGGIVYSNLAGDIEQKESFGVTAGLEIFLSEKMSADVAIERIDTDADSWTAGVNLRF